MVWVLGLYKTKQCMMLILLSHSNAYLRIFGKKVYMFSDVCAFSLKREISHITSIKGNKCKFYLNVSWHYFCSVALALLCCLCIYRFCFLRAFLLLIFLVLSRYILRPFCVLLDLRLKHVHLLPLLLGAMGSYLT